MNILEVTEDKFFQVLGKGRDLKFKPIEKTRLDKNFEPFDFSRLLERIKKEIRYVLLSW